MHTNAQMEEQRRKTGGSETDRVSKEKSKTQRQTKVIRKKGVEGKCNRKGNKEW
jgi:hypothetical protein